WGADPQRYRELLTRSFLCRHGHAPHRDGVHVWAARDRHKSCPRKETRMWKQLVSGGLISKRRARTEHSRRRPAYRPIAEALEDRLVLSGDMVLRWNEVLWQTEWTAGIFAPVNSRVMAI